MLQDGYGKWLTRNGFEFAFPRQESIKNSFLGLFIFAEKDVGSRKYSGTFWNGVNAGISK